MRKHHVPAKDWYGHLVKALTEASDGEEITLPEERLLPLGEAFAKLYGKDLTFVVRKKRTTEAVVG